MASFDIESNSNVYQFGFFVELYGKFCENLVTLSQVECEPGVGGLRVRVGEIRNSFIK